HSTSHKKSIFFSISVIIFAKICISIRYKDFITQNVQPANFADDKGSGQSQFAQLKLRSLALVPSCRCTCHRTPEAGKRLALESPLAPKNPWGKRWAKIKKRKSLSS
ncbi:MAG: hypothetical protein IJP55_05455, partial [Bacteroidales bacterium]|nr:hypothetical protein [Bacteroidales bacterium]